MWSHYTLDDPGDLDDKPPCMTAHEAQEWSNFTVVVPTWLPDGTEIQNSSQRREAPPGRVGEATAGRSPWSHNNPSAFRFEIAGESRRLRVKEFLYDWAFPALDHPSLWESVTTADRLDNRYVVWHGIDYMGHQAASARLWRTMVETSILHGHFDREELTRVYQSMAPVSPDAAAAVAVTPFAQLSYWARRRDASPVGVPLGLWTPRQPGTVDMRWAAGAPGESYRRGPSELGGLRLESWAVEVGRTDLDAELAYFGGAECHRELRVHVYQTTGSDEAESHDVGVEAESHPSSRETVSIAGYDVRLAWIDEQVGPFDAIVLSDANPSRRIFRVLSSSGVGCDKHWFMGAVKQFASHDGGEH